MNFAASVAAMRAEFPHLSDNIDRFLAADEAFGRALAAIPQPLQNPLTASPAVSAAALLDDPAACRDTGQASGGAFSEAA